jgi:hypothetical protein
MRPGTHAADDGSFRRDAGFKIGRAIAIIVVAAAVAVVLLHKSSGGGGTLALATVTPKVTHHHAATTSTTVTSTTRHHHGSTTTLPAGGTTTTTAPATTTTEVPIAKLVVVVANGTETFHAAAFFETKLQADGYQAEPPANATSTSTAASVVYFQPGFQNEAATLATTLGLPATVVQPYSPAAPLPSTLSTANIVVLVGQNLAAQVTAG